MNQEFFVFWWFLETCVQFLFCSTICQAFIYFPNNLFLTTTTKQSKYIAGIVAYVSLNLYK